MSIPSFIEQAIRAIEALFVSKPPPAPIKNAIAATQKVPDAPPAAITECPLNKGACGSGMNIDAAVDHLDANFLPGYGQGRCAEYVRKAIEAGGVKLDPNTRPLAAKDYGPYLEAHGFKGVPAENYVPQKGDVVVIQSFPDGPLDPKTGKPEYKGSEYGHITMYDGDQWGSDFAQTDMWSGPGYRKAKPPIGVYRP